MSGQHDLTTLLCLVTNGLQLSAIAIASQLQEYRIRLSLVATREEVLNFKRKQEDMGEVRVHQSFNYKVMGNLG